MSGTKEYWKLLHWKLKISQLQNKQVSMEFMQWFLVNILYYIISKAFYKLYKMMTLTIGMAQLIGTTMKPQAQDYIK